MQYVRLQCRRARGGTFEFQLETQMLDVGERDAQCLRGCPVATQPLHAFLACGGAETCRVHVALPVVGSRGVAGASDYRERDRKSTRLNSSHLVISYAVFCLKKKKKKPSTPCPRH